MITAAYQFVKDMTVTAVRLLLQNLVWQHAPLWVANKSLKGAIERVHCRMISLPTCMTPRLSTVGNSQVQQDRVVRPSLEAHCDSHARQRNCIRCRVQRVYRI